MKLLYITLLVAMNIIACSNSKKVSDTTGPKQEVTFETKDSVEYELIVFDPKFETFLVTQPFPKDYYSDNYYSNWNYRYCVEWNIRHADPLRYGSFYETDIPYDPHIDYGIDFNYRLYQYFRFIEKEYGIVLIRRRGN